MLNKKTANVIYEMILRCRNETDFNEVLEGMEAGIILLEERRRAFRLSYALQFHCKECGSILRSDDRQCLCCKAEVIDRCHER